MVWNLRSLQLRLPFKVLVLFLGTTDRWEPLPVGSAAHWLAPANLLMPPADRSAACHLPCTCPAGCQFGGYTVILEPGTAQKRPVTEWRGRAVTTRGVTPRR